MYPNDPFQPAPTGVDYLNQIAPPAPPEKKSNPAIKILFVVLAFIGLLSISMIIVMATQDKGPTPTTLLARLQKLHSISKDYHKKISSSALQDTNSSLSAVLTTANRGIKTPLADYEINADKLKGIASLDPSDKLRATLDEAYLNYRLNETYIREMSYQLEETIIMMKTLRKGTKSKNMKEFLEKTIADFENLNKRFVELGPTDESPDDTA